MNWDDTIDEQYIDTDDLVEDFKSRYQIAKQTKVREKICCPVCQQTFIKKYYQQCFHSKRCKDRYWNMVVPERRDRALTFA
jgi:hypothetical protein